MDKCYKNFILCGEIDYYCLLCQETFGNEADIEKHFRWQQHRKNLEVQEYLPKYRNERIYKIKNHYYCEVCNVTTLDVDDHIKGDYHNNKNSAPQETVKKSSLVKRESDGTVKIKDKVLSKFLWHGIKRGACSLCAVNINIDVNHLSSFIHMANLIQSRVKCKDDHCYRELKSDKFYCFTCFETYENKYFSSHWYEKHSDNKSSGVKSSSDTNNSKTKKSKLDPNNNMDDIDKAESKYYKMHVEKTNANCLECDASVEHNSNVLYRHARAFHPNSVEVFRNIYYFDHGKRRSEIANYGKVNYIKLNEGGSKAYCSLCDMFMSAHMTCVKQHVQGSFHRGCLELKGLVKDTKHAKPPGEAIPYTSFTEDTLGPFSIADYNVLVLNNSICIELLSFTLIRIVEDFRERKAKCFACDVTFNLDEIPEHCEDEEHMNIVMNCIVHPWETDGDKELIRQVRPGLYHCGCCNKAFPFWENMSRHLKSMAHQVRRVKDRFIRLIREKLDVNPLADIEDFREYDILRETETFL